MSGHDGAAGPKPASGVPPVPEGLRVPRGPGNVLRASDSRMSDLRGFVQDELIYLWSQLADAYRSYLTQTWMGEAPSDYRAGNDMWSGRCDGLGARIVAATALVGPVSWRNIPIPALVEGWYVWVNSKLEITNVDLPTDADFANLREYMAEQTRGLV